MKEERGEKAPKNLGEAERSKSVQIVQIKEKALLDKRLAQLDKTCATVVNRISVDQKVMFRRFQRRMLEGNIAHARLMGRTELERELRGSKMSRFGLNTSCGQDTDEERYLKQSLREHAKSSISSSPISKRPDTRHSRSISSSAAVRPALPRSPEDVVEHAPRDKQSGPVDAPRRAISAVVLRRTSDTSSLVGSTKKRPKSCIVIGSNTNEESTVRVNNDASKEDDIPIERLVNWNINPSKSEINHSNDQNQKEGILEMVTNKFEDGFIETAKQSTAQQNTKSRNLPSALSIRRPSSKSSNLFGDGDRKARLMAINTKRVESAHFEDRMKDLETNIEPYKTDTDHVVDYYTSRLMQNMGGLKKDKRKKTYRRISLPSQPCPEEFRRATGGVKRKPLTFKDLDYDFDKRQTTFIDLNDFIK